jgi:tRNA pseudouridine32 synthase / 23S rRNA pseudouridine746 synthase
VIGAGEGAVEADSKARSAWAIVVMVASCVAGGTKPRNLPVSGPLVKHARCMPSRGVHKGRHATMPAMDADGGLELLHEDDSVVVVAKPAGLLAVPGRLDPDSVATRLQARHADALVVHRLDQATSGLMLFARGAVVQRQLGMAFESRRVHKRYLAIVEGVPAADAGAVDAALSADWPNRPRQFVDQVQGKPSLTRWRVLRRDADSALLELEPVTGRTHQLRVHLAHIGHPIAGDRLYAPPPWRAGRLLLHASELAFDHPGSGQRMHFRSAAPFA